MFRLLFGRKYETGNHQPLLTGLQVNDDDETIDGIIDICVLLMVLCQKQVVQASFSKSSYRH